jgi:DNA-binding NarL/FixJ family response regulator
MAALVGRAQQLATLRSCVDTVVTGTAQVAVLEGVAGVGKTRLIEESLARMGSTAIVALLGAAEELEENRPFGPLARALAASSIVSPTVLEMVVEASSGRLDPSGTSQYRVIDELLDHLEELATSAPVVLCVDDLQWADPATMQTLLTLIRRLGAIPILLLLALRPLPRSRQVDRVIEAALTYPARHVRLAALDDQDIDRLLADVLDAEPGVSLRTQVRRAGGNPFYLHELLRALEDDRAIEIRGGRAEVVDTEIPATLGSTILRHLRFLEPDTLEVLEHAAVLGTSFTADDLAAFTRRRAEELIIPLRHGGQAGVLHDRAGGFAFRHDLVREALYGHLPRGLRAQLHLQAAGALADVGAPSARIATHVAIGAQAGDRDAIARLRRAAVELTMTAPDIAEGFARRAIELSSPAEPDHDDLRADLVTLLVATGQPSEAHQLASALLASAHDDAVEGRVRFASGQASFLLGDLGAATEQMRLAAQHPSLGPADQSLALSEAAMVQLLAAGDLAGAQADAGSALAAARAAEDPIGESMALCVLAGVEQFRGNIAEALTLAGKATTLGAASVPIEPGRLSSALRDPHMFHGMVLVDADELDAATAAFGAGAAVSATRGVAGRGHFYHYWLGYRHYLAGTWDDCVAELETGLEVAQEIENRRGILAAHALLGLVALHRDELTRAEEHIRRSERQFAADGPDFGAEWMLLGRALLSDAQGATPDASALLGAVWQALDQLGSRFHYRTLAVDLTRLSMDLGDTATASRVTSDLEELAKREALATLRGTSAHCRGLLQDELGPLLEAVEHLRAGPRVLPLAAALEDAAVAAAREGGRVGEARELFHDARARYGTLGAARDVNRLVARMRAAGLRTGTRGPRQRPDHGWDSLTETEHRVAELVAEGLSNPSIGERLFVSRRTVQTHVSNVFRKLSLSSRTQLATAVLRRRQER